ncbi:MAG: DinB family protein, partial [Chloroflexota bacterium]|nr:DinB family protein [Chloroflexota bacterium]
REPGMTTEERAALIAQYKVGYNAVLEALDGITEAEWDSREGPEEWSTREIVHHLGDSEMGAAVRIRMLVAEAEPVVMAYDERRWTERLYTAERPIPESMAAFQAARNATAPLLDLMTDEEWTRPGRHSERGAMTAETWLEWYGPHAHDHADQIRRARAAAHG